VDKLLLLCLPLIGALIGWLTNYLAVKMLFRPQQPVTVLGLTIQGLVPKRQPELAERVGEIVEKEFGLQKQIQDILNDAEAMDAFRAMLCRKIDDFIVEKTGAVGGIVSAFLNNDKLAEIRNTVVDAVMANAPEAMAHGAKQLEERLNIKETVSERIATLDLDKLEEITRRVAHRELRHIEILGGVLGFTIGLVQAAVVWGFFSR